MSRCAQANLPAKRCKNLAAVTAPASRPLKFVVRDGSMRGGTIQINAAFFDLINTAWPRNFYTLDFAPGLKYFR